MLCNLPSAVYPRDKANTNRHHPSWRHVLVHSHLSAEEITASLQILTPLLLLAEANFMVLT